MKNTLLASAVFLFSIYSTNIQAQDDEKQNGIRAGFSSANVLVDGNKYDDGALSAFYAGFFRNNKIVGEILAIHSGVEYIQTGFDAGDLATLKLHYVSVPIGLRAKVGPVYGLAGVGLNFKVGQNATALGKELSLPDDQKPHWFDAPLFLGTGIKLLFFSVDFRYHWGLVNIENRDSNSNTESKNQYLQLGASVYF